MVAIAALQAIPWLSFQFQSLGRRHRSVVWMPAAGSAPPESGTAGAVEVEEVVEEEKVDGNGSGCKACGRSEVMWGCNGLGRIQGGIGGVPGFGWWPIKAFRPCPAFLESGGRYKRQGQRLDEFAYGRRITKADEEAFRASLPNKSGNKKGRKRK